MNPAKMKPYKLAYDKKVDFEAYTNGLYVRMAVMSSLGNEVKYPAIPFGEQKEVETESQMSDADMFACYAIELNKKLKNESE